MQKTSGNELDKTSLAKELSSVIMDEIRENSRGTTKSEIEKEIDDIMNVVNSQV
jgi:hypothetical protein